MHSNSLETYGGRILHEELSTMIGPSLVWCEPCIDPLGQDVRVAFMGTIEMSVGQG